MSIGTFVSASFDALQDGKYDIALALTCSAVDATATRCFPSIKQNNQRYKSFLKENMRIITTFGMPGLSAGGIRIKCSNLPGLKTDDSQMAGLEDILYHIVRCGLLHQCEIDREIVFTNNTQLGDFENRFRLPFTIVVGLLMSVVLCEYNKNEHLPKVHTIKFRDREIPVNAMWGLGNEPENEI